MSLYLLREQSTPRWMSCVVKKGVVSQASSFLVLEDGLRSILTYLARFSHQVCRETV